MRGRLLLAVGAAVLAAAVAVVVVVVFTRGSERKLTRAEYVGRLDAICEEFGAKLADIPSPVGLTNPTLIAKSIENALPLVRERVEQGRAVPAPVELEARAETMFARATEALARLEAAGDAARSGDLQRSAVAVGEWVSVSLQVSELAAEIGVTC